MPISPPAPASGPFTPGWRTWLIVVGHLLLVVVECLWQGVQLVAFLLVRRRVVRQIHRRIGAEALQLPPCGAEDRGRMEESRRGGPGQDPGGGAEA